MQKIIKIMNFLIICAILFTIFYYNKNDKLPKQHIKKSYNHPGAVYFPYSVINGTKEKDYFYKQMNGQNKQLIYIIDNHSQEDRDEFQQQLLANKLINSYTYVPISMPKAGEIKCVDGSQSCFVYFFMQRCSSRNISMCIINPKTKELLPVPDMPVSKMIEYLQRNESW